VPFHSYVVCVLSDFVYRVGINPLLFCPLSIRFYSSASILLLTLSESSLLHGESTTRRVLLLPRIVTSMVGRFLSTMEVCFYNGWLVGWFLSTMDFSWQFSDSSVVFDFLVFISWFSEFGPFSQFRGWLVFFWEFLIYGFILFCGFFCGLYTDVLYS